eukprot:Pgem_evm1s17272
MSRYLKKLKEKFRKFRTRFDSVVFPHILEKVGLFFYASRKTSIQKMVLRSKNTNLDALVGKYTLLHSILSSGFSIFRFFTEYRLL